MRTRRRLGAVSVVALGALLLATALASPAFAWDASVKVFTKCLPDGDVGVKYVVKAWERGHAADVTADFSWDDGQETRTGELDADGKFADEFTLPAGTTGKLAYEVRVDWKDSEEKEHLADKVWLPKDCEKETTTTTHEETTTTTQEETTTSSGEEETTTTSGEEETTTSEVLGETSTTGGGALPFTGASSGPMLLAGIGLIGGGLLFLWSSRTRNQTSE
jgi:hypothetical protein